MTATMTTARTLTQVFEEFLADQEARISHRTYLKYYSVIDLYKLYLESYWPGHDQAEYRRITKAGGTFCGTFGPEEATAGFGEFLGYFMPRKVMCGKETMQAAGTVTKKLAKWLVEKGYLTDTGDDQERAGEAARHLPKASKVLDLLDASLAETAPAEDGDDIEDHFWIERIEPGKLWLKPLTAGDRVIGPVLVPRKVTDLCQPMWDIGGGVSNTADGWRFVEVWNVSP